MRPNVKVLNNGWSALLKQRDGANQNTLLDFASYGAVGSAIDGVIIDQNASQNAPNVSANIAQIWDTNDVSITNCRLVNGTFNGITGRKNRRTIIKDTWISDIKSIPIYFDPGTPDYTSDARIEGGRIFGNYGQHCINIKNVRGVTVDGVKIQSICQRGFNIYVDGHYVTAPGGFFAP